MTDRILKILYSISVKSELDLQMLKIERKVKIYEL